MGLSSYEPRERLAAYLRRRFAGEHQTKRLAGLIGCTPKTAENILNGHWPNSRHWAAIVRGFGRDVIEAVFSPEIDETVARLEEEVRALEQQLEEKLARKRQIAGARVARAHGLAALAPEVAHRAAVITNIRRNG